MHYKVILLLMLWVHCSILSAQSQTKNYRVHFKVDEYQLDDADRTLLNTLIQECKHSRYCELNVSAHTDNDADDTYNMALSRKRADAVTTYLTQNGVAPNRFNMGWYGERKPDASNTSETGKSENRRVDVQIRAYNFQDVGQLLEQIAPPSVQTFTINSAKENKLVGKHGTSIVIPRDALQTKSGKPVTSDKITIRMEEFLQPSDAAFHQLSTICEGRILETGGMFTIKATAGGEELELKKGKELDVELPSVNTRPDMELFEAVKTPEGIMEWKATSKSFVSTIKDSKPLPFTKVNTEYLRSIKANPDFSDQDKMQYTYRLPAFPVAPRMPYKPRKYVVPTANDMYSWVARVILPDSYIEKQLDKKIATLEKNYNAQMERYNTKKNRYNTAYARYQQDSATYEEVHGIPFRAWLQEQKTYNEKYTQALEQQSYNRGLMNLVAMNDSNAITMLNPKAKWLAMTVPPSRLINKHKDIVAYIDFLLSYPASATIACVKREMKNTGNIVSLLSNPYNYNDRSRHYVHYTRDNQYASEVLANSTGLKTLFDEAQNDLLKKRDEAGITDQQTVNQIYGAKLSSFGTFNCDRFNATPPRQLATIRINYTGDARVSFHIPSMNGYVYANRDKKGYFISIPKNTEVKVVFVAFSDAQGLVCSVEEKTFTQNETITPELKQTKLVEMKEMLASL
jgi:hypothetical protein